MIKNVLLPEKIGSYYLFSKRILSFCINSFSVTATKIYLHGSTITVEDSFEELLGYNAQPEDISGAIENIIKRAGRYDVVYSSLPSARILFKKLSLPFESREKIEMVLPHELESMIPFEVDEVSLDFIITDKDNSGNTNILVAVVKKNFIAEHIAYFEEVGVSLSKITIDLFAQYGLYKEIPLYQMNQKDNLFISVGFSTISIAYLSKNIIQNVRVIPKGIKQYIDALSSAMSIDHDKAMSEFKASGLHKSNEQMYQNTVDTVSKKILKDVLFTVSSFKNKFSGQDKVQVLLSGLATSVPGFAQILEKELSTACGTFLLESLFEKKEVKRAKKLTTQDLETVSFAAAYPCSVIQESNLLPEYVSSSKDLRLLMKQFVLGVFLMGSTFSILIVNMFYQTGILKTEIQESELEVVDLLQQEFSIKDEDEFETVIEEAQRAINKEESVWFAFSLQSRTSFLKYLLALHELDKKGLGLVINKIRITDKNVTLDAKVKDHNSVIKLEKKLRKSKLFKYAGSIQKTEFSMKIPLARKG